MPKCIKNYIKETWKQIIRIISFVNFYQKEEMLEEQYDLLMSCLPKDAENLSTLTKDQAWRLMKCFIKKSCGIKIMNKGRKE